MQKYRAIVINVITPKIMVVRIKYTSIEITYVLQ